MLNRLHKNYAKCMGFGINIEFGWKKKIRSNKDYGKQTLKEIDLRLQKYIYTQLKSEGLFALVREIILK